MLWRRIHHRHQNPHPFNKTQTLKGNERSECWGVGVTSEEDERIGQRRVESRVEERRDRDRRERNIPHITRILTLQI